MLSLRGLLAVLVTAGLVAIPISHYWEFLTRGQQPSAGTLRLNQLEKEGVPDFSFPDLNGKSVSLSQFGGKAVLVNLWASWCAPCVKEFPSLKGLVEHFKGDLVVLAISHDHTREDLDSFIKAFGEVPKDFVILWDKERKSSELFGTDQLPETYILNREHKMVRKIAGEQVWNDPMALDWFKDSLGL
jgi:cytochrome c biogenesis protein CcmG/thiol:disulfide interchange protein DsbE